MINNVFRQPESVDIVLVHSRLWSSTPRLNQSSQGESEKYFSPVGLSVQLVGGCCSLSVRGFTACSGSFPSCREENYPDSKSGQHRDPEKPVWSTSCWEDLTNPSFLRTFLLFFCPRFHDYCKQP